MKHNSNAKALVSGVWYTIGNFITRAIGFITIPFFTRLMSAEDIGDYSNFHSWVVILLAITSFDLYTSVAVAKFDYRNELDDYIASNLILGTLITSLFYVVALSFKAQFLTILSFSDLELHIAFIYFLVYPSVQMIQIRSKLLYKYKTFVFISLFSAIVTTGVSLLCVVLLKEDQRIYGRLLGYYVPMILLSVSIYIYLIKKSKTISTKYWGYALKISLPLVWHTLSANLLNSSDKIMINSICGKADAAMYSVAYTCAIVVSILWNSMNAAWAPWAYEKMDEKDFTNLKKASKFYIVSFGIVVFLFLLLAPEILLLMGGKTYQKALSVIPPVMVAYVFQFVYSLYVNIETYMKKQKYIAVGTTIAAALNIILNAIFIPKYGYTAAAYTTLVGYIVLFTVHYLFVKKIGKESWYDTKFNVLFLCCFLAIMATTVLLYRHNIIRYVFIGLLFALFFSFVYYLRTEIVNAVKHKKLSPVTDRIRMLINKWKQ